MDRKTLRYVVSEAGIRQPTALREGSIIEVSDMLESFLVDRVIPANWQHTLWSASMRSAELGSYWSDSAVIELGQSLKTLAGTGLDTDTALTRAAADKLLIFRSTSISRLCRDPRMPTGPFRAT
jgi:hypothetical protein